MHQISAYNLIYLGGKIIFLIKFKKYIYLEDTYLYLRYKSVNIILKIK